MPSIVVHPQAAPTVRGDRVDLPPAIFQLGTPAGLFVLLVWALAKNWFVQGGVYKDLIHQRDDAIRRADTADARASEARQIALQATKALEDLARRDDLGVALLKSIERQSGDKAQEAS